MQRESLPVEIRTQLAIAHARFNRDLRRSAIEIDDFLHLAQREEMVDAVRYAVEAVPRPENLETVMISDELLNLRERVRRRDALCAVAIIPSPVDQGLLGPGDRYAIDHPRHRRCPRHARTLSDELTPAGIHHGEPSSASRPCGGWIIVLLGRMALQQTLRQSWPRHRTAEAC